MKILKIILFLLIVANTGVSAQTEELSSYHYVEVQGGGLLNSSHCSKILTPAFGLSYGYMSPYVGGRISFNGLQAKAEFNSVRYKFNYLTTDIDLLVNLTNLFSRNDNRFINLFFIGGIGFSGTWNKDDMVGLTKHNFTENLRLGLRAETNITKQIGVSLEIDANNRDGNFSGINRYKDDWGFTGMLGVSVRFGHKYKTAALPVPTVDQKNMTYFQMMQMRLKEEMAVWKKRMPGEKLKEYRQRVTEENVVSVSKQKTIDISTKMAQEILGNTTATALAYNSNIKKMEVSVPSMPNIYLGMEPEEAEVFQNNKNIQLKNAKYIINPDNTFTLLYAEAQSTDGGKSYIYDNMQINALDYRQENPGFISLDVMKRTKMEATVLKAIKDKYMVNAKNQKIVSDKTHVSVDANIEQGEYADGVIPVNYNVDFTYEVEEEFSARDDFKPGHYVTSESKAAVLMLQIMKEAYQNDFANYIKKGKKVVITIKGTADASPIKRPIAYNGVYGEFKDEPVVCNGKESAITLTKKEGIATNEQLAFLRAVGVRDYIEKEITGVSDMDRSYKYVIEVSKEKGSKFRRISVQYTFVDAF